MITLICDKCAKVFGCRPHYHYENNLMIRLCETCSVSEYCSNFGENVFSIKHQEMDGGFCPACILEGGGV